MNNMLSLIVFKVSCATEPEKEASGVIAFRLHCHRDVATIVRHEQFDSIGSVWIFDYRQPTKHEQSVEHVACVSDMVTLKNMASHTCIIRRGLFHVVLGA